MDHRAQGVTPPADRPKARHAPPSGAAVRGPSGVEPAESLLAGQKRVLELLATGADLNEVLEALIRLVEEQSDGIVGSVLIRSQEGDRFAMGVAPSLPDDVSEALGQVPVTPPYVGPCARAAHLGEEVVVTDAAADARWSETWRDLATGYGLPACYSAPILASDGEVLGAFGMYRREPGDPKPSNQQLLEAATHLAGIAIERKRGEQALRDSKDRMAAKVADLERLHTLSMRLLQQDDVETALREVMTASAELLHADRATVQMCDPSGALRLVSVLGFDAEFAERFRVVEADGFTTCAAALRWRGRVLVDDLSSDSDFAELRRAAEPYGVHAALSTPLYGSDDRLLGVFTMYWNAPHRPAEDELWLLDLYTQQAARQIERTWAEEEIHRLNLQLEQRVVERTAQLQEANRELEAFAYSVSHDLRAPLRGVDGFSQALMEDYGETLDEAGRTYLQRIRAGAGRMGSLIDDLLNLSRLSSSRMDRRRVDLSALAEEVFEELRAEDAGRQVEVRVQEDMRCEGDANLLKIALENLISNAWKFTQQRECARIEVGTRDAGGETVYFVRDNGAGFDPSKAEKLFRPFERLHTSQQFEGTGLGLAAVARIVRRHGGDVEAEGRPGEGATFRFWLSGNGEAQERSGTE